jgi:hypothetical protein
MRSLHEMKAHTADVCLSVAYFQKVDTPQNQNNASSKKGHIGRNYSFSQKVQG